jgi:hypothetical protein
MSDGLRGEGEEAMDKAVSMTPTQLNEVILEKLALLAPRFENLRDDLVKFQRDLTNGMIHWNTILERAKREC